MLAFGVFRALQGSGLGLAVFAGSSLLCCCGLGAVVGVGPSAPSWPVVSLASSVKRSLGNESLVLSPWVSMLAQALGDSVRSIS